MEPLSEAFEVLKRRHRNAHLFQGCLSTRPTPEVADFSAAGLIGGIIFNTDSQDQKIPGARVGQGYFDRYEHKTVLDVPIAQ